SGEAVAEDQQAVLACGKAGKVPLLKDHADAGTVVGFTGERGVVAVDQDEPVVAEAARLTVRIDDLDELEYVGVFEVAGGIETDLVEAEIGGRERGRQVRPAGGDFADHPARAEEAGG